MTRVFHGPNNIAGAAGTLARAQRAVGVDAQSVCFGTGSYAYEVDRQLEPGLGTRLRLLSMAKDFDIFQFYFGESLSGSRLVDVPWLQRAGKKVFFYFCGCDIRDSKTVIDRHEISACAACWPMGCSANRNEASAMAAQSDGVFVSTPDLLEFVPDATLLLQPVEMAKFELLGSIADSADDAPDDGIVRIAHAPSSRTIKGTKHVEAAVAELQENGLAVELVLVEGRSYAESLAIYRSCDLAVDQMLIGAYGQFAVETMGLGKPTICYVRDDLRPLYPGDVPIINATPNTLAAVIDETIRQRGDWPDIAARGRSYVIEAHEAGRVAAVALKAYGLDDGETT